MWQYRGQKRPEFATVPGPGQESVWDYPRPPELRADGRLVEIFSKDQTLASSGKTYRVLETASPPSFYIPIEDVKQALLKSAPGHSVCEWKGRAQYWSLADNPEGGVVGWSYPNPTRAFAPIKDYIAFYPAALACYVAGERVRAQPGRFYGGWITNEIVGPFKGQPGTESW
jgi:uncharacterized protein (DUF427 family)